MPALNKLYEQYGNRVSFLTVYITEAHPTDHWQTPDNLEDKILFASPNSEDERASIAGTCVRKLDIKYPSVLDEFGNSTEKAYTGWPDRIYLIDAHGKIAYKSKPGPFGFRPKELGAALAGMLDAKATMAMK